MPGKVFQLDNDLSVTVFKRRGSRNVRLSVGANGSVRVTIPAWASYRAGAEFARARQDWIHSQRIVPTGLVDGQAIGKAHHLHFVADAAVTKASSRVSTTEITVRYPTEAVIADADIQTVARKACVRALRAQAEKLLPQRLATLARQHDFSYNQVSVKQLKGRWGSCDQQKNIVFNLFLMQLPWELIDYVILHELVHTRVLRHGPEFWQAMETVLPGAKDLRKRMHEYQPVLR